jgi:hypothetical protein
MVTRRQFLQVGGLGYLGLGLPVLLEARAAQSVWSPRLLTNEKIKACILIFYYGGPSHLDTFDMKPAAPAEVRGEFKPIATSVPGLRVCEHLPRLARLMHKTALVRSVHHKAHLHDSASIHALTGRPLDGPDRELFAPLPQFFPSYGSAVAFARRQVPVDVPFASLPFVFQNVQPVPCQGGGILGPAFDPLRIEVDALQQNYRMEMLSPQKGVNCTRRRDRRKLLDAIDRACSGGDKRRGMYEKAFRLLDSPAIREALDVRREPNAVRERYGFGLGPKPVGEGGGGGNGAEMAYARQMRGQNLLVARRLVEAGVPFVNVYDCKQQGQNWDAHFKCFNQHKTHLLPLADQSLSALIEELDLRGLLDTTLVVAMGEFGRTPRINKDGGRDHWPSCYTILLAGGGVQGGAIHGSSDKMGAFPSTDPVTPADLAATIYWRFGLDPAMEIRDQTGRPYKLAEGQPLRHLFAKRE